MPNDSRSAGATNTWARPSIWRTPSRSSRPASVTDPVIACRRRKDRVRRQRPVTGHEQVQPGCRGPAVLRLLDHLQQGEGALAQAEPHHGRHDR